MSVSHPEAERVTRIVGNAFNTGTVFESAGDVRAVREAADLGWIRVITEVHAPFRLHDDGRVLGIELTLAGLQFLGIDPVEYYRK